MEKVTMEWKSVDSKGNKVLIINADIDPEKPAKECCVDVISALHGLLKVYDLDSNDVALGVILQTLLTNNWPGGRLPYNEKSMLIVLLEGLEDESRCIRN